MNTEPIVVKVDVNYEEAVRKIRNLAATATGLRLTCERLELHLTDLEARADKLGKRTLPEVAKKVKSRG